jgi:predicted metal-binding protein
MISTIPEPKAELHICVTCRAGLPLVEGAPVLGRQLYDNAAALMARLAPQVTLRPVVCLGNCAQGCSAAVSQPGKWSYLLGHMTPDHAADLVAYGAAFAASENGTVWRSGRAESLRDAIVARIPGFGFTQKETA